MSRFAALRDSDSDETVASQPKVNLSPQYSIDQILSQFNPTQIEKSPPVLSGSSGIEVKEVLKPECLSFQPPTEDINSTCFLNTKNTKSGAVGPVSRAPKLVGRAKRAPIASAKSEVPQAEESGEPLWVYKDFTGQIIGPFQASQMRSWLLKKYIDNSLQIRTYPGNDTFQAIGTLFPVASLAFPSERRDKRLDEQKRGALGDKAGQYPTTLCSFSMQESGSELEIPWD